MQCVVCEMSLPAWRPRYLTDVIIFLCASSSLWKQTFTGVLSATAAVIGAAVAIVDARSIKIDTAVHQITYCTGGIAASFCCSARIAAVVNPFRRTALIRWSAGSWDTGARAYAVASVIVNIRIASAWSYIRYVQKRHCAIFL
jgi:hypothetical protein